MVDENPKSELPLAKRPGDAEEPDRLRELAIPSKADARDEVPMIYAFAMPLRAGEEAWEAVVEAVVAVGEDMSCC